MLVMCAVQRSLGELVNHTGVAVFLHLGDKGGREVLRAGRRAAHAPRGAPEVRQATRTHERYDHVFCRSSGI
jgi:hypothetical protein